MTKNGFVFLLKRSLNVEESCYTSYFHINDLADVLPLI